MLVASFTLGHKMRMRGWYHAPTICMCHTHSLCILWPNYNIGDKIYSAVETTSIKEMNKLETFISLIEWSLVSTAETGLRHSSTHSHSFDQVDQVEQV